ncbi:MAG: cation transporter [Burkholderiaceae bacterium]|nr:cation transporter [Burkholderiaceae bacterium]
MRNALTATLALVVPLLVLAGEQQTAILDVQNMTCGVCPITVRKALQKVPGVSEAKVDLDGKTATVRFDAARADVAALVKATTEAGFPSTARK